MKRSTLFLVISLCLALVFSAASAAVTLVQLNKIKENTNAAVYRIVALAKEKYPEMSEYEIARLLNSEADGDGAKKELEKYGITDEVWAVFENDSVSAATVGISAAVCLFSCLALCAVFALYARQRRNEARRITEYIARINNKEYDLSIERNSEDEMSHLKNELYKVTVNLREEADNSLAAKQSLKKSLEDISHQLKTPATSILIMVDNILDDDDMPTPLRREFLQDIRRETNGISFLVQSLLTLSRLDADAIVLKRRGESAQRIIKECAAQLSVLAELKGVAVKTRCDGDILISCDFRWICEAVSNIVKNCIEHTQKGGEVTITAQENKVYAQITVSDNGDGIDERDLPHIFDRFYKGKNSSADSVGIGLALSKAIIEKSGGRISVVSKKSEGTRFDIKLFKNRLSMT